MTSDRIGNRLNHWKRQLIDLTRRNRLLNYRPTSASTVEIVDEDPHQIYRQLIGGEVFTFDPVPDPEAEEEGKEKDDGDDGDDGTPEQDGDHDAVPREADDPDTGEPAKRDLSSGRDLVWTSEAELPSRHRDTRLQTRLDGKRLDKNLLNIYRKANESMEEQGFNTLFLALGMVEWSDPSERSTRSKAPLLMMPVRLTRATAASAFRLEAGDDEPFLNLALVEKLRVDFKIDLPDLPEFSEETDIAEVIDIVRKAVAGFGDWRLTADVALGLFSFQKFVMYRDIERNEAKIKQHRVIRAICNESDDGAVSGLPEEIREADLDKEMAPWDSVQVLDADSSQQRAILAARKGYDLVIEGPPGTGKSQTITNLIADALHEGKSVLFVSEKMAALEVVKDRLEQHADLASHVLELHSNKASKREFVEELSRSLDDWNDTAPTGGELDRLRQVTADLKAYVVELHRPEEPLGRSPFEGFAAFAALVDTPRVLVSLDGVTEATAEEFDQSQEHIETLAMRLRSVGDPAAHPLRGLGLEHATRSDTDALTGAVDQAGGRLSRLVDHIHEAADLLGLRIPTTLEEVRTLSGCARVLARTPGAEPAVLNNRAWNELPSGLEALIQAGETYRAKRKLLQGKLTPDVLDAEPDDELATYRDALERGAVRFLLPRFWKARGTLRSFLAPSFRPESGQELISLVQDSIACREARAAVRARQETGEGLFGERWRGVESDWEDLRAFAEWVVEFRRYALQGAVSEQGLKLAGEGDVDLDRAERVVRQVDTALEACEGALEAVVEAGTFSEDSGLHPLPDAKIEQLGRRVAQVEEALDRVRAFSAYVAARNECEEGRITRGFAQAALDAGVSPDDFEAAFSRRFLELWCEAVVGARPVLGRFQSEDHGRKIREFREADERSKDVARDRVRAALEGQRSALLSPDLRPELQTLQREAKKRRNILPIRRLISRAPGALQVVKPCFMMSPLSVAQFLDTSTIEFDLVVFDEASQIPPPDAIGAIVRARQVVVVGDSKQLPPTNFFGLHLDDENPDEDDEIELIADLESILDEVAVSGTPSVRLKWHYRSQHESLIRFSNEEFYQDDPLYVFPTASREEPGLGLEFKLVRDGVYEGRGRNTIEARTVAEAVVDHIQTTPKLSLGVGTFGVAQQNVILDELDRLRRDDPSIEWFFQQEGEEKFFVKNLENIQGDNRDVILLSVTYGPDANGVVRRNFGPLNKQGGWRRLNVLTTRAKRRLAVFSTMSGDRIDPAGIAEGAALLRKYLIFAETGEYPASNISMGPPDSPFEKAVIKALESRGYRTVPQVGDSGYRIDIGVLDPERAGRYVCGIECDGASYHSAATVRDRDRLRQQVLEDRGWDIHRVWSTDWFHSPRQETERLVQLIEESQRKPRRERPAPEPTPVEAPAPDPPTPATGSATPEPQTVKTPLESIPTEPYVRYRPDTVRSSDTFYTTPIATISKVVLAAVAREGPIHESEIARRVAEAWGMQQAGRRIRSRVREACHKIRRHDDIAFEGDFYWRAEDEPIAVRSRDCEEAPADPSLIALCEIIQALRLLLTERAPLLPDEVVTETARVLGFGRTGSRLRERITEAKEALVELGEVRVGGTGLYLTESSTTHVGDT
ncbi:MAG: DUF3320 domain-containing protein [Longimicrobiales bacterium]